MDKTGYNSPPLPAYAGRGTNKTYFAYRAITRFRLAEDVISNYYRQDKINIALPILYSSSASVFNFLSNTSDNNVAVNSIFYVFRIHKNLQ